MMRLCAIREIHAGEFTVFRVSAQTYGLNSPDECLLKDVVGYVLIFDYPENIAENSILMTT